MKTVTEHGLTILSPDEGKRLALADRTAAYEGNVYLGKSDSPANYIEVTSEEADSINGIAPTESSKDEALKILGVDV